MDFSTGGDGRDGRPSRRIGACWHRRSQLSTGYPVEVTRTPQQELEAVWERVRERGVYHFSADIVQTTIPLPKVTNIGRQNREDAYYLEGQTNLPQQQLDFTLWSEGGSIAQNQGSVAVRVDGDGLLTHLRRELEAG